MDDKDVVALDCTTESVPRSQPEYEYVILWPAVSRHERLEKLVRAEGLEPSRALRPNGFSYRLRLSPPLHSCRRVWGLDYPFTISRICLRVSGAARLVSTPSRLVSGRAWLGIAMLLIVIGVAGLYLTGSHRSGRIAGARGGT